MSIIEDIQRRSAHIHWPQGIVPEQADLFAHSDIVIAAPPVKSGSISSTATTAGPVLQRQRRHRQRLQRAPGPASVRPDHLRRHIHSTVHEFEPAARIGWYGERDQWLAYHTWLLEPRDEGTTYVVMEETGSGLNPKKLAGSIPATCTAVTTCGTSASSSSAKAPRPSGDRTPAPPVSRLPAGAT